MDATTTQNPRKYRFLAVGQFVAGYVSTVRGAPALRENHSYFPPEFETQSPG